MRRFRFLAIALAVGVLGAEQAHASGFQLDIHDAHGTSRGFAMTAGTEDASAMYYNPAAITLQEGTSLRMTGTYLTYKIKYRADPGQGPDSSTKREHAFVPSFFGVLDLHEQVDVGLSVFTPFALATQWPRGWTGRYQSLKQELAFVFINPMVAVKVPFIEGLSLSAGPQIVFDYERVGPVRLNRALDFRNIGQPDGELLIEADSDNIEFGYAVAAHYIPPIFDERLRFGITWRATPAPHELRGDAQFRNVPASANLPNQTSGTADLTLPPWLQVGVQVEAIEDTLWLEFDYKWTGWSTLDELQIDFAAPNAPDSTLGFEWEDVNMFMFGVDYRPLDWLGLRMGYFFDEDPVPQAELSPILPDSSRHGVSAGFGVDFDTPLGHVTFDFGYMHLFFRTASKQNLEGADSPGGSATANGRYRQRVDLFTASFEIRF